MEKIKQSIQKSAIALVEYAERLLSSASAALLASAIIVPDYSFRAMLGCLCCVFVGAILVVWRKSKE